MSSTRTATGDTGSLKRRMTSDGGVVSTAPSSGTVSSRTACACASPPNSSRSKRTNGAKRAITTTCRGSMPLRFGQESQERRRFLVVGARLAGGRYFDPAVHAVLAFLHGREIQRLARPVGKAHVDAELIEVVVEKLPGPGDLHHRLGDGTPVTFDHWRFQLFLTDGELPALLGLRLHADDAVGNAQAHFQRGRALAAMRNIDEGMKEAVRRRLIAVERDMAARRLCADEHSRSSERDDDVAGHAFLPANSFLLQLN